jgi:hypothetical protein
VAVAAAFYAGVQRNEALRQRDEVVLQLSVASFRQATGLAEGMRLSEGLAFAARAMRLADRVSIRMLATDPLILRSGGRA